jgi:hypothetical protein
MPGRKPSRHPNYAAAKPTIEEILASETRFKQTGTDFLKTDLETALTFSALALGTRDDEKRKRNRMNARKGYDTIVRLMGRLGPSKKDARFLARNMRRLKSELERLGEVF